MTSYKNFSSIVQQTDVVQRVVDDLVIESAQILREVVKKFEATGEPIGDHHLPSSGYFAEVILRALVEAGQIEEVSSEGTGSLHRFKPTRKGNASYKKLKKEERVS